MLTWLHGPGLSGMYQYNMGVAHTMKENYNVLCIFVAHPVSFCIMRKSNGLWLQASFFHDSLVGLWCWRAHIPIRLRCELASLFAMSSLNQFNICPMSSWS